MQFSILTLGFLASTVAASGIHIAGKRAPLPADCKRAVSAIPSVSLQTTLTDPQPTMMSGGMMMNGSASATMTGSSGGASMTGAPETTKNGAGVLGVEKWGVAGVLALVGGLVMV